MPFAKSAPSSAFSVVTVRHGKTPGEYDLGAWGGVNVKLQAGGRRTFKPGVGETRSEFEARINSVLAKLEAEHAAQASGFAGLACTPRAPRLPAEPPALPAEPACLHPLAGDGRPCG